MRRLQEPIGADATSTRVARRGELDHVLEISKSTLCAPMADPLDSGDDVSATGRLVASRLSHANLLSCSDLRQTQERRGSKAAGGTDETCKREGSCTVREGPAAAG